MRVCTGGVHSMYTHLIWYSPLLYHGTLHSQFHYRGQHEGVYSIHIWLDIPAFSIMSHYTGSQCHHTGQHEGVYMSHYIKQPVSPYRPVWGCVYITLYRAANGTIQATMRVCTAYTSDWIFQPSVSCDTIIEQPVSLYMPAYWRV